MSGIEVAAECKPWYDSWVKDASAYRVITFRMNKVYKNIIIDEEEYTEGDNKGVVKFQIKKENKHDEMECITAVKTLVQRLKEDETNWPRWIFVKIDYNLDDGRKPTKLVRINWCPEHAKVKSKMVFSASEGGLKLALDTNFGYIQCDELEEVLGIPAKIKASG